MKLQSTKARVPIAALGVTALVCGMGALASPSAFAAPASLTLNSGGSTQAVGNFGSGSVAAANAAYALKVTDATAASPVTIKAVSAPTGGNLEYQRTTSNAAAITTFSSLSPGGTNEVQSVAITGGATGGTYTLTYSGQVTTALAYNATASTVQSALAALSNVGTGNIAVTGGPTGTAPLTVTFQGTLAATNVAAITAQIGSLTGGTPAAAVTTTTQGSADNSVGTIAAPLASTDYVYVTGDVPGTYTYRLFEDTNSNSVYDAADERSSELITLKVYDVGGTGGTPTDTSDDVSPVLAATTPGAIGQPIVATVSYSKALSLSDARGSGVTTGLAGRLAALTFFDVTPGTSGVGAATDQAASYSTSTSAITYAAGTPTALGTVGLRADLKTASATTDTTTTSFGSKSIVVNDNKVASLALAPTLVDNKVIATGGAVTVKAGTSAVTYTATAMSAAVPAVVGPPAVAAIPAAPVAGATVTFTVSGTVANMALLTTDGTAVDTSGTTSKTYSAVTNASGVASLTVTSSTAAAAGTYTVGAVTNGISGVPTLTATYAASAAAAIVTTSTATELTPAYTATSVMLKGKLTDQFGSAYIPASSASQQVGVEIPDGTAVGFATIGTDGTFSYTYTPTTAPAAGSSTTFDFSYTGLADNASLGGTIRFASTTAASKVTITAPADLATGVVLQTHASPAGKGLAVTGSATDATNVGLAFATVTLTGSDGVYYSSDINGTNLSKSFTAVTDNSGALLSAYAFFTKSGTATVIATSGTATDTNTVTTADSIDPYKVVVNDVVGSPGSTLIVTGKVMDMFGNGVPDNSVALDTGSSTVGTVASPTVFTNQNGVFSTTFVSGSNQSGDVTLTATLYGHLGGLFTSSTVLTPATAWKTVAGLTFEDGDYQDEGTIKVAVIKLTLTSTAKLMGGGKATVSGTFMPSSGVDIYSKPSGADSYQLADSVETNGSGEFSTTFSLKKTTAFLAKSAGLSSGSDTTLVYSTVTLTAKSTSKGRATLSANGSPSAKGTLTFYRSIAGKDPILKSMTSNANGNGYPVVKLPKGTRTVYVIFKAPGTNAGTSKSVKVKVK